MWMINRKAGAVGGMYEGKKRAGLRVRQPSRAETHSNVSSLYLQPLKNPCGGPSLQDHEGTGGSYPSVSVLLRLGLQMAQWGWGARHPIWSTGHLLVCVLIEDSTGTRLEVEGVTEVAGKRLSL